jgi:hypothetical protein
MAAAAQRVAASPSAKAGYRVGALSETQRVVFATRAVVPHRPSVERFDKASRMRVANRKPATIVAG